MLSSLRPLDQANQLWSFLNPDADHIPTAAAVSVSRSPGGSTVLGRGLRCPSADYLVANVLTKAHAEGTFYADSEH